MLALGLLPGALVRPLLAQETPLPAIADPPPLDPASPPTHMPGTEPAPPVLDIPPTPPHETSSQITALPDEGELSSGNAFNDHRFGYVLHGEIRAAYESNIFIREHGAEDDFIFTIQPGIAMGWGDFKSELFGPNSFRHRFERYLGKNYIFADYSPSYTWFASHGREDTFDHDARVEGEWTLQRLTLGLRARYFSENVAEPDIGDRVEQRHTDVALTSRYEYSGKTSFEVNAYYSGLDYAGDRVDSYEWKNEDWLNYQISPKIRLGVGGAAAYVDRSSGPTQTYEQGLVRVKYEATQKLTAALTAGAEWHQTQDSPERTDGVFQFDLTWTPADGAYLYLQAYRHSFSSGLEGSEYFLATGVSIQYRQRLFQRFYFELTAGYQNSDYKDPLGSPNFGRSDDLVFIRPGVGFDLTTWLNCQLTGEYQKNSSSSLGRSYDTTIAAIRLNLLF